MKAVVMAGGEGTRLRPLTIGRPKPMVPIVNRPCLEHLILLLKRHGIIDLIITLQYLAPSIQNYFGDGSSWGMNITYSIEDSPLGTAGSVRHACAGLDEPVLVVSGDALTDINLNEVIQFHRGREALATLTLYRVPNPLEYGVIIADDEGRIRQFLEKPGWGEVFSDTINTGIYVIEPEVLDYIAEGRQVDFSAEVFPALLARGAPLFGCVADGYWCDIGNIVEYARANADVLAGNVDVGVLGRDLGGGIWTQSEDVEIAPDALVYGPVFLGNGVKIRSGAIVNGPTVIRESSVVDEHAHVDRSVIWRDSYIGERAEVRGAFVCRQCSIKSRAVVFEGAVVGDGTAIGEGSIIQPNVKIWPNKEVERGATVTSSIIWGSQGRRSLFGRYGVTGLANIDLTPEFAAKLGAAYGSILPKGATVTMNRDFHRVPRMVKRAMIAGLPSAGINVLDVKSIPVPAARYITRVTDAVGGVHVRLSQFDARTVDIRFFDSQGLDLDTTAERRIENAFAREDFRRVYLDDIGTITDAPHLLDLYTNDLEQAIDIPKIQRAEFNRTIVVDFAHSSQALVLPPILNQLKLDVITLNASIDESRIAVPKEELEQSLAQLAAIARTVRAGLAVRFDASGERMFVVDNEGRTVSGPMLLAAIALLVLRANPGKTIAVPISAPLLFEKLAAEKGSCVIRTKVYPQSLMAIAAQNDTVFVGDAEGGMIFPQFQPAFDALYATAKIIELLAGEGTTLSEVLASLPPFHVVRGHVPCPWDVKGKVMRLLSEQLRAGDQEQIEGIRIPMGDEWVLILPDADRPLFQVIVEAAGPDKAQALLDHYMRYVSDLAAA